MALVTFDFLDVGQGDGTFVQVFDPPNYQQPVWTALVDYGSVKNRWVTGRDAGQYLASRLEAVYRKRGSRIIDLLVLTHGDQDHYNLLPMLIQRVPTVRFGEVVYGGEEAEYWGHENPWDTSTPLYNAIQLVRARTDNGTFGVPNVRSLPSDCSSFRNGVLNTWRSHGDLTIHIVQANFPYDSFRRTNEKSVVLLFKAYGHKVLLPGDATYMTMREIVAHLNAEGTTGEVAGTTALRLPHHGSERTARSYSRSDPWKPTRDFAALLGADMIVVGADVHGRFRHPRETLIQQYRPHVGTGIYKPSVGQNHRFVSWGPDTNDVDTWVHEDTADNVFTSLTAMYQGVQWQLRLTRTLLPQLYSTE
ncbi:MAG TPA: hypothetical protein VHG93_25525 [Longimicrobium sp.]|nr:hypothetical protein [Longimicrobium sp.]